jgi:DNA-binding transcriptional LysR family regulator
MHYFSTKSIIAFYEVAKNRSFTKTATRMFTTQPGISIHVKKLESELGTILLRRSKADLVLTKEGKEVLKIAEQIYRSVQRLNALRETFKRAVPESLTVGSPSEYGKYNLPKLISPFLWTHRDLKIKIETGNSGILVQKLLSAQLDLAITPVLKPSSRLWSSYFAAEELVAVVPVTHELASKDTVSLIELKDYPLLLREPGSATRNAVLSAFTSFRITPRVVAEIDNAGIIMQLLSGSTNFVSILPKGAATHNNSTQVRTVKIREKIEIPLYVVCAKTRRYEPLLDKFINYLTTVARSEIRR